MTDNANPEFNVLEHFLVPEHRLLSDEEAEAVLEKYGINKDQLPKIKTSDAALQILSAVNGTIPEGSVIEIKRGSETAGTFTAYRLVVEG